MPSTRHSMPKTRHLPIGMAAFVVSGSLAVALLCVGISSAARSRTTTLSLNTQPSCINSTTVTINIDMTGAAATIVGGQFFVAYDTNYLQFVSADPGDPPFTRQVFESVDPFFGPGVGHIDYSSGIEDGGTGTAADTTMARLTFNVVQESCTPIANLVTWRATGPGNAINKLSDDNADPVVPALADLDSHRFDHTPPLLSGCPADTSVECADDVPAPAAVTANDNCDGVVAVDLEEDTKPGDCPNRLTITRTWTATDACDNSAMCSQTITVDDTTPPTIDCPDDIEVNADTTCTATVNLGLPTGSDNCDPPPTYDGVRDDSEPLSAPYPLGVTSITWTATDACGNTATCKQTVTVNGANSVGGLLVELEGNFAPVSRCIRFVPTPGSCATGSQSVTLNFVDHDGDDANHNGIVDGTEGGSNTPATPVRAVVPSIDNPVPLTLPCGAYTHLCAKDEQHTLWATTTLTPSGSQFLAGPALLLRGGDTDNDGDVDINDVTYFIFTFATPAAAPSCPWNGVRDANFNNNAFTFSEDYTFLSQNWLSFSSCGCTLPLYSGSNIAPASRLLAQPTAELSPDVARVVDLHADGVFDYRDVERFEQINGLPALLSTKLRPAPSEPTAEGMAPRQRR
jgi:hypothetical protein